jgi:hypothetical protein
MHSRIQSLGQDFGATISSWHKEAITLSQACQTILASLANTADDAENSLCEKAQKQVAPFQAKTLALREAYAHIESVWVDEHRKQAVLVHAADTAAR